MCTVTFTVVKAEVNIHFYSYYIHTHGYEDASLCTTTNIQHPRTFLLFKLSPIFSSFRPITFSPGSDVAVTTHLLWVGLSANHYLATLLFLPPLFPHGTCPPTRLTDRFRITISCCACIGMLTCDKN